MSEDGEVKLQIRLFGAFEAAVGGKPLPPLRSQKGRWLLALLALRQGQEVPRTLLAQLLWPERLQSEALTGLRQLLMDLRRALGVAADAVLTVTSRALCLAVAGVEVDAHEFDRAVVKDDPEALQRAAALYRGPLLEECTELWVVGERETRERRLLQAIERLSALAGAAGADQEAIGYLRRGIAIDPISEPLHRALLRALSRMGDYGGMARAYQTLRQRLHDELHAVPSAETQNLYRQLSAAVHQRAKPEHPHPPPMAASSPIHLPRPLTPLIGREVEIREVIAQLVLARLVTLAGAGGAGKTRLAIQVATMLATEYTDGVWFIDLSALTAPGTVPWQVAHTLGLPEERGFTPRETLIGFLRARQALLVLDNCEHLIPACAELAASLLSSCPELRILATSRQKLGLMGESVYRLAGLSLPERGTEAEKLRDSEAIRLFMQRAQAVCPTFKPGASGLRAVAALCQMLDGLPLGIELAATWIETLTPEEIAERLEEGLDLPPSDDPTRPRRHQTLEALMDSSYDLLSPSEQTLLCRLAVFVGGWTLPEAEAICGDADIDAMQTDNAKSHRRHRGDLLPELSRLVAKSLVIAETREGRSRYRLLDIIHRYAERRLERSGDSDALRARCRDGFLHLAEEAERHLTGPQQTHWLMRLDEARDNLRAALHHAEARDSTIMLRLVNALGRFWQIRGYWSEGRDWIDRALKRPSDLSTRALRANALNWAALLATYQGDLKHAHEYAGAGLAIWEELEDKRGIASSLGCLGIVVCNGGDYAASRDYHIRSREMARASGDEVGIAGALGYLGNVAMAQSDFEAAQTYYTESLERRRTLQDTWGVAASLNNLGLLARHQRDWTAARRFLAESLQLRRQLGDRRCIAISLNLLGLCAVEQGDAILARQELTEGLTHCREIGDKRSIAYALEAFAALGILEGQRDHAASLLGAASALREAIASPLPPSELPADLARKQMLRAELGDSVFMHRWNLGGQWSLEEAILLGYGPHHVKE